MQYLLWIVLLVFCYILGSVPFGLLIVKLSTGKDIRNVESGRTGGTNAARAAGLWAGLLTAFLDFSKAASAVLLAKTFFPLSADPVNAWIHIFAPLAAIAGHNYSIFLLQRNEAGYLKLRGGAGGAPSAGGASGLWPPSIAIILPLASMLLFGVGYASLATLSVGLVALIIFAVRAYLGLGPWPYVLYGLLAEILLAYSLRPNIQRLIEGRERLVGIRARSQNTRINSKY